MKNLLPTDDCIPEEVVTQISFLVPALGFPGFGYTSRCVYGFWGARKQQKRLAFLHKSTLVVKDLEGCVEGPKDRAMY